MINAMCSASAVMPTCFAITFELQVDDVAEVD